MTSIYDRSTPKVPLTCNKGRGDHERLVEIFKDIEAFSKNLQSVNDGKKVIPMEEEKEEEKDTPPPLKNLSSTPGSIQGGSTIITIADFKSLIQGLVAPDSAVAPSFVVDQLVAVYGLLHRLYQECLHQDCARHTTEGPSPEDSLQLGASANHVYNMVNPPSGMVDPFMDSEPPSVQEQCIAVQEQCIAVPPPIGAPRSGVRVFRGFSWRKASPSNSLVEGPLSSADASTHSKGPASTRNGPSMASPSTSVFEGVLNLNTEVKEAPAQHGTDEAGFDTINNYAIVQELGRGNFGKVMLACDEEGNQVAIKSMSCITKAHKHRFARPKPADTMVMREVAIMKKLRHKNIVQLKEVIHDEEEDQTHLVMDYICNGALADVDAFGVCTSNHITIGDLDAAKNCIHQAATGLEYLHRQGIVHRDVKPENLLVGADDDCYLADFGVSAVLCDNRVVDTSAGTQTFFSPELLCGDYEEASRFGEESDVWALGVTFYAILFGKVPFFAPNVVPLAASVLNAPIPFPSNLAEDDPLRSIFQGILHKDARKRWTLKQLRQALRVGRPQLPERLRNDVNKTDPSFSSAPYSADHDEGHSFTDIQVTEEEVQAAILNVSCFKSSAALKQQLEELHDANTAAEEKHSADATAAKQGHADELAEAKCAHGAAPLKCKVVT